MSAIALVSARDLEDHRGRATRTALLRVRGVPLVSRAVRALESSGHVRHVVVMAPPDDVAETRSALEQSGVSTLVIAGDQDRFETLRRGLCAAREEVPDARTALVHDAARAFAPTDLLSSVLDELGRGAKAVIPVLPLADTVKRVDWTGRVVATPDRSSLRVVQTPQGFPVDVLAAVCEAGGSSNLLDRLQGLDIPVTTVPGHPYARRISTPFDLTVAEAVLAQGAPATHSAPRRHHHVLPNVPTSGKATP